MPALEREDLDDFVEFTRDQVRELRRPAWATGSRPDIEFYFDGAHFWRQLPGRLHQLAGLPELPSSGWFHSSECTCAVCVMSRRLPV